MTSQHTAAETESAGSLGQGSLPSDDELLANLLRGGPGDSREVKAAMDAAGVTSKRTRRARERLGVVVERFGSGNAAGSRWSLPSLVPAVEPGAELRKDKVWASSPPSESLGSERIEQHIARDVEPQATSAQLALMERRVHAFVDRGVDPHQAQQVATLLLERDRAGLRDGSCAECQNFCPSRGCDASEFSGGARPVGQLWFCWYARRPL